jgi:outer membrane immunogenic protein
MRLRIFVAVATVLAFSIAAHATGFGAPPPGFTWSGFYVGGHVGHADADFDGLLDSDELADFPEFVVFGSRLDVEGVLGGVQAGYNQQWGMWVLGIEGDVGFLNASDKVFDPDPGPDGRPGQTDNVRAEVDTLATLRVRGGPTFGRFFVFGTVGAAWADAKWTACDCEPLASGRVFCSQPPGARYCSYRVIFQHAPFR